ncbi:lipopolysaccharide biosynthesis protein [Clostridium perfringens]
MNREHSLIKNTFIITIGKIFTQLITFFLLPLYTSILSTEDYGTIDLLNTLVALLLPIVTFQIEQGIFRELIEFRDKFDDQKKIITSGVFSVIVHCSIYLFIFSLISPFIHNKYKVFLATNVITFIFNSLFLQIARGLGENTIYAFASFLSAFATIIFNILFILVFRFGANGMLLGTMLGQITCIIFIFLALKLYRFINFKDYSKSLVVKLLKYSIPLVPNAISWWIFNASDRVIVSAVLGLSQNGILSAAYKFSAIYITFYNIFNLSWTESISLHINDEDIESFFNKIFNTVLRLFVALGIGFISCMPFVYPIMINSKFREGYVLIPILIIASVFNVVVGLISVIYVGKKNTKAIANTSIVAAVMNIVIHLLLINYIGLYAAAISTLVSFFVMSIYRIYDINKKYFKINIEKNFIFFSLIILLTVLVTYYINDLLLNIISLLIAIIYTLIINKSIVNIIINLTRKKLLEYRSNI